MKTITLPTIPMPISEDSVFNHMSEDGMRHLISIDQTIHELLQFGLRISATAPIPHQYIGTIINVTAGLLSAPMNSLNGGDRHIRFESYQGWSSLLGAVHRSFFSLILTATEQGLDYLCIERNIKVVSHQGNKFSSMVQKIQDGMTDNCELQSRELKALAKHFAGYRPLFSDYLETVFKASLLDAGRINYWRKFFKALSIARNKASHPDTSLSDRECTDLSEGGCAAMIGEGNHLATNTRMFVSTINSILQFFDELYAAMPAITSSDDNSSKVTLSE